MCEMGCRGITTRSSPRETLSQRRAPRQYLDKEARLRRAPRHPASKNSGEIFIQYRGSGVGILTPVWCVCPQWSLSLSSGATGSGLSCEGGGPWDGSSKAGRAHGVGDH